MYFRAALAATLLIMPAAALAQAGTAADNSGAALGAAALTAGLKDYLGPLPFDGGFVAISHDPNGYRITLAAKGSFATDLPGGSSVKSDLTPYALVVNQRPAGNWQIQAEGPPSLSSAMSANGQAILIH